MVFGSNNSEKEENVDITFEEDKDEETGEEEEEEKTDPDTTIEDLLEEIVEEESSSDIGSIIQSYSSLRKNKDRANYIDELRKHISDKQIQELLINITKNDSYPLCRAKALSSLVDLIDSPDVKQTIIGSLDDISPKVRLWAVWGLRSIVHQIDIQELLIKKLKYFEKSRKINLWIIRALSDQIDTLPIQETFLFLFKLKPDTETKKLLLYYLLMKTDNPDILYTLTRFALSETNKEIRMEIVKRLVLVNDPDVRYTLETLLKSEKNKEIREVLEQSIN